jgi:hypothetical protein
LDKDEFRRLTGGKEEKEETPEEVEARRERFEEGEETLEDVFAVLPEVMRRKQEFFLNHYGLDSPFTEEQEQHSKAMHELMSKEQCEQYMRARKAYGERDLPPARLGDPMDGLLTYAATHPPEDLRKHIWRLRGSTQP